MENTYLRTYDKKECNGCGLCELECPVKAIRMVEDQEGFLYPVIDKEKCINCKKCLKVCSNHNDGTDLNLAYMAINKNIEDLSNSSSGGIFYLLAKYVIEQNGVVFGVEYNDKMEAQHNYYDDLKDCKKFQGSKYVRSNLNNMYIKVKENLLNGKYVLFTGTPCQCQGLKKFLKKDYNNLILCDIICHSNPSPKVFKKYISELEQKYNKKIVNFIHRPKDKGWHPISSTVVFDDGTKIDDSLYFNAFGLELLGRPSCHQCKFTERKRVTDFTIADLWGVEKILPDMVDDNTGISLICINSEKAAKIFKNINKKMFIKEVDKKIAFSYNHNTNVKVHRNREKFFKEIDNIAITENMKKNLKESQIRKVLKRIKKNVKKFLGR